jgi:IS6 family transposase
VRWYLRFGLSFRNLEELMVERNLNVDHVTIWRWVQRMFKKCHAGARRFSISRVAAMFSMVSDVCTRYS